MKLRQNGAVSFLNKPAAFQVGGRVNPEPLSPDRPKAQFMVNPAVYKGPGPLLYDE